MEPDSFGGHWWQDQRQWAQESLSLKIFKSSLGMVLSNWL